MPQPQNYRDYHLFHTIQTCCRCVYPKGEMHWFSHTVREAPYCETKALTEPVSMSYISAPRLHQSTAFPWPVRIRISGALKPRDGESASYSASSQQLRPFQGKTKKQQKTKLIDSGRENGFCFMPVHTCVTECAWNGWYMYATGCTFAGIYIPGIYSYARWSYHRQFTSVEGPSSAKCC